MGNTTQTDAERPDGPEISKAIANVAERCQRLVVEFLARQQREHGGSSLSPDPLNLAGAFFEMTARLLSDPNRLISAQVGLWNDYLKLWQQTSERFLDGSLSDPVIQPSVSDKRFKSPLWNENALFDFIKQSYLLSARFMQTAVQDVDGLDQKTARKLDFYTRQFVDAMAPSNFVITNPEVLQATIESKGENLLKGLGNMLDDLERGKGQLSVRMTNLDAFTLGENIAATPGKVIFQNHLFQLLQYNPVTEQVRKHPLLLVPPWINKYYILDLKPQNSFIKWAVTKGHTVFVISWVNPDEKLAEKSFEDYMDEGFLSALDAVERATGEIQLNVIGYCIGGTLVASSLAYLAVKNDKRALSATYFTTLVDFTDAGDLAVFVDEEQLQALDIKMRDRGYLEGREMFNTFNMLRSNDLIWSFVVNNYLLGKEPFPFDLLYWNSDSTRMPYAMHMYYLRNMYQENRLVQPGGITMRGVPIDLSKIKTPSFILATKEDHIAPWQSVYTGTQIYRGPTTFCLAGSGHIAGVINAPDAKKYNHWLNPKLPTSAETWLEEAASHAGSWWDSWDKWISEFSGGMVPARAPGDGALPVIEDAPGSYVKVREA